MHASAAQFCTPLKSELIGDPVILDQMCLSLFEPLHLLLHLHVFLHHSQLRPLLLKHHHQSVCLPVVASAALGSAAGLRSEALPAHV